MVLGIGPYSNHMHSIMFLEFVLASCNQIILVIHIITDGLHYGYQ